MVSNDDRFKVVWILVSSPGYVCAQIKATTRGEHEQALQVV